MTKNKELHVKIKKCHDTRYAYNITHCTVLRLGQCLLTNTCTYGDNYCAPYTFIRGVHLA